MTDSATVLAGLDELRPQLEELYQHLHAHPELSNQEVASAARMAEGLRASGFEVHEQVGASTGVVGILRNGEGPVVLLRADMDGLPVLEDEKVPYRSRARGTWQGTDVPIMHACGHDTHMTALQGATRLLADSTDAWSGTLVAVFQPAEEVVAGAYGMAEQVKELVPHIDVALGQHVWPAPAGTVHTAAGPVMASTDGCNITIHSRGGHGSQPENTVDPVVIAAHIVVRLQTIVSREIAPQSMAVVTVGRLNAGSKGNIIPATAEIEINIRSYDEGVRAHLKRSIERIVNAECAAAGEPARAEFEWITPAPVTDNDPPSAERLGAAFDAAFGDDHWDLVPVAGSEDFGVLGDVYPAPYVFWFFGGFPRDVYEKALAQGTLAEDVPSNHAPNFIPEMQPTLDTGVRALVVAAMEWLARR
ncbi:amidohydrolase [Propionibacteriaceae bacterium Y1923]|uniref:amidohydrolase n=1 Tax=Aestuariimicrobium sp. Y1814 TaxID=3418742 RepID=UPI003C15B32A